MTKWLVLVSMTALGCGDNHAGTTSPDGSVSVRPDAPPSPDGTVTPPPGVTFFNYAIAVDVTPDGRTAVFEDLSTGRANAIAVDTVSGAIAAPIDAGDPSGALVTGIASTGRMTAMHGDATIEAGVLDGTSWSDLASPYSTGCDPNFGGAWDISADGKVVVGFMWNGCNPVAFRWVDGAAAVTPLHVLGASSDMHPPTNRATVVSDDGTIAAGFAENLMLDRSPAIWNADGTGHLIDATDQTGPGEVLSINADGTHVAGIWANDGFTWTSAGGRVAIPRLDSSLGGDPVYPNAMSADGRLVFGGIGDAFFSIPFAFVWSDAAGTRDLTTLARNAGLAIPSDTLLDSVLGASADGTVLIGTATSGDGTPETFMLRLPASAL
jgi:uncharacterized membrane protein